MGTIKGQVNVSGFVNYLKSKIGKRKLTLSHQDRSTCNMWELVDEHNSMLILITYRVGEDTGYVYIFADVPSISCDSVKNGEWVMGVFKDYKATLLPPIIIDETIRVA